MSGRLTWTRRAMLRALGGAALAIPTFGQAASDPRVAGAALPSGGDEDRGIGGTGIVGTIQKFGSIFVNDVRVAYPRDATVTIDGLASDTRALRIGQVVHLVASPSGAGLDTTKIAIVSEVVGPIEEVTVDGLVVLGQSVDITRVEDRRRTWRVGERVAVSGLRMPGGTIAATLLAPPAGRTDLVRGLLSVDGRANRIGGLDLLGLPAQPSPAVLDGRRVIARGWMTERGFVAASIEPDAILPSFQGGRWLIEAYVQRSEAGLEVGNGLVVSDPGGALQDSVTTQPEHTVVDVTAQASGAFGIAALGGGWQGIGTTPERAFIDVISQMDGTVSFTGMRLGGGSSVQISPSGLFGGGRAGGFPGGALPGGAVPAGGLPTGGFPAGGLPGMPAPGISGPSGLFGGRTSMPGGFNGLGHGPFGAGMPSNFRR